MKFELISNQGVEVAVAEDNVSAEHTGCEVSDRERVAEFDPDCFVEEGDLAFVIRFVVEEPVASDALSGDALDGRYVPNGVFTRRFSVMSEEVVSVRNVDANDLHGARFAPLLRKDWSALGWGGVEKMLWGRWRRRGSTVRKRGLFGVLGGGIRRRVVCRRLHQDRRVRTP